MHYYQFNIGDYRRQTGHLSLVEHGIYRSLLDTYYLTEQPLCADHAKLMRSHCVRTSEEMQAFENVINDFFILDGEVYKHKVCDEVICKYREKSEKAKKSAKARWDNANASKKHANASKSDANAVRSSCESDANHKPITKEKKRYLRYQKEKFSKSRPCRKSVTTARNDPIT